MQCSIFEHRAYKVIYRRYASLFFMVGVDDDEVSTQQYITAYDLWVMSQSQALLATGTQLGLGPLGGAPVVPPPSPCILQHSTGGQGTQPAD